MGCGCSVDEGGDSDSDKGTESEHPCPRRQFHHFPTIATAVTATNETNNNASSSTPIDPLLLINDPQRATLTPSDIPAAAPATSSATRQALRAESDQSKTRTALQAEAEANFVERRNMYLVEQRRHRNLMQLRFQQGVGVKQLVFISNRRRTLPMLGTGTGTTNIGGDATQRIEQWMDDIETQAQEEYRIFGKAMRKDSVSGGSNSDTSSKFLPSFFSASPRMPSMPGGLEEDDDEEDRSFDNDDLDSRHAETLTGTDLGDVSVYSRQTSNDVSPMTPSLTRNSTILTTHLLDRMQQAHYSVTDAGSIGDGNTSRRGSAEGAKLLEEEVAVFGWGRAPPHPHAVSITTEK